nr:heavy metal translocating P-type ATPase [Peptoniphilus raoultii]
MRILLSLGLLIFFHFIKLRGMVRFALYMLPYLIIGHDVLLKAFKGIKNRQPFDENLLMSIATIGAIILALYEGENYLEAIAVMLFYQIGEFFQSYAVGRSRKSIADLMDIAPDYVNLEGEKGKLIRVDPDDVEVGTIIIVKAGEKIPIDGIVVDGKAALNTSALTGESMPRDVREGSNVISGCINLDGLLKIKTTKEFGESTVSKVLELIEDASSRKSKSENFITKFARVYTPIVVFVALALILIPPLVLISMEKNPLWGQWIYRGLTFLIISCPCALVISIPLSFFTGIGGASREGILVKGSNFMEILSQTKYLVFDKTGTLTKGTFSVTAVHPEETDEQRLLHIAAHVERYSTHPIAQSLREAYPGEADDCEVKIIKEIAGNGVKAEINGKISYVGNENLMDSLGISWHPCEKTGTIIHVAIDRSYAGHIVISDSLKENSRKAIEELKKNGIKKTVMLTGDKKEVAQSVAEKLGIDKIYADLLPQDKVKIVEKLLDEKSQEKEKLAFVGDGINDAPVLSRADIGIAMGAMGSDAVIEAADVVLMDDDPLKISKGIKISKKCLRIVKENIYFSIGIKVFVLFLGAIGLANMWAAIFADVGVTILAVLNAVRCMYVK